MAEMKPPPVEDQSDDFGDGFTTGLFFQAMIDGQVTIKHSVRHEVVDFILAMAADNSYEFETTELEDDLVDIVLVRVG